MSKQSFQVIRSLFPLRAIYSAACNKYLYYTTARRLCHINFFSSALYSHRNGSLSRRKLFVFRLSAVWKDAWEYDRAPGFLPEQSRMIWLFCQIHARSDYLSRNSIS